MILHQINSSGTVYWITGLSGAGKTTIGKSLYEIIASEKQKIIFLDGDELRKVFGNDLGYSREDRIKCAKRYSRLCNLLASQGFDVICCTVSMFHEIRNWNRKQIKNYIEIYIKVSISTLEKRNQKGLYGDWKNGSQKNVVGLDLEVEYPEHPDFIIENNNNQSPYELANELWYAIKNKY